MTRLILALSATLAFSGLSLAKHGDDDRDDDHNDHRKRAAVIVVQEPEHRTVVVTPPPVRRVVVRGEPQDRPLLGFSRPLPLPVPPVVLFTDRHRTVVREYYRKDYPKHHKRHVAPPGWRKRVVIGKPVPRDIVMYSVPQEIEVVLPPLPRYYVRFMIGGSVLVRDVRTGVVVDACYDDD